MKRLASEDKNAYLVDMSKATLLKDRLHFDKTSAEYLGGRQMYETMLRVSSSNVTVHNRHLILTYGSKDYLIRMVKKRKGTMIKGIL